jgi:hypothetical protein
MKRFIAFAIAVLLIACTTQKPKSDIKSVTHVTKPAPAVQEPLIQIKEVSKKGNFFRIDKGAQDGVALGHRFLVIGPDLLPLFEGQVVGLRPKSAFLRVKSAKAPAAALQIGLKVTPVKP